MKIGDDILQDLFFQITQIPDDDIPVHADVAVEGSSFVPPAVDAIGKKSDSFHLVNL